MEHETSRKRFESVYSTKVRAGKRRTYFFDVRRTKGDDYYITLTESTRRFNGDGYERHKIFLYKEDFNRFLSSLEEAVNHVKTELMPNYDYDEFTKRQQEWEARRAAEAAEEDKEDTKESETTPEAADTETADNTAAPGEPDDTEAADSEPADSEAAEEVTAENSTGETTSSDEENTEETTAAVDEGDTSEIDEEEDMSW